MVNATYLQVVGMVGAMDTIDRISTRVRTYVDIFATQTSKGGEKKQNNVMLESRIDTSTWRRGNFLLLYELS